MTWSICFGLHSRAWSRLGEWHSRAGSHRCGWHGRTSRSLLGLHGRVQIGRGLGEGSVLSGKFRRGHDGVFGLVRGVVLVTSSTTIRI